MAALLSSAERQAMGQARRKQLRRQQHAAWHVAPHRTAPATIVARSMQGRIRSLVDLKYERMLASPFGFFRGAAPVMAADLAGLPNTGILAQICGDAHVRNLGSYAAPDGRLIFDINDFDETCSAPFEWDLKRMATSLVLAGRENGQKKSACRDAVLILAASYRKLAATLSRMPVLDVARYQVHRLARVTPVSSALQKAERETPLSTLEQLTEAVQHATPGKGSEPARRFQEQPPLLTPLPPAQARALLASLSAYRQTLLPERRHFLDQYKPVDTAFKVVGTGSVGLRDYLIYLEGNGERDPLFLQVKEEPGSAYAPYLAVQVAASHAAAHQGQRVAEGQRAMQLLSDPFLGWTTIAHRDYLVRQLNDHKASVDMEEITGQGLADYAAVCGELLARGHARSGDVHLIIGYLGAGSRQNKFDEALAAFADAYADQTEADWHALAASHKGLAAKAKRAASATAR